MITSHLLKKKTTQAPKKTTTTHGHPAPPAHSPTDLFILNAHSPVFLNESTKRASVEEGNKGNYLFDFNIKKLFYPNLFLMRCVHKNIN
jgi:hypothetical protein